MKTFFSHARVALKFGLIQLGCQKKDRVIVPDYICEAALTPLRELGIKIDFYSLDKDFSPNWQELEDLFSNQKYFAIMMVHYFGIPQNILRFKEFCDNKNIFLIEDNAHGYGGFFQGKLLGTFGHIGISSPRKILNTPSGGILYKGGALIEPNNLDRKINNPIDIIVRKVFTYYPMLKICYLRLLRKMPNIFDPRMSKEKEVQEQIADNYSQKVINNSLIKENMFDLRARQQERWNKCLSLMQELEIRPLYDELSEDVCPWLFPIIADSIEERKRLYDYSLKHDFILSAWPTLPPETIQRKSNAYSKWFNLLFVHLNFRI
jgi:hypothetical protein